MNGSNCGKRTPSSTREGLLLLVALTYTAILYNLTQKKGLYLFSTIRKICMVRNEERLFLNSQLAVYVV
jgi:hypothetical protein